MKINDIEILEIAYKYIKQMSQSKKFNLQARGITSYFPNEELTLEEKNMYLLNYDQFKNKQECIILKDFVYKNDFFTPREMYIISPEYYLYYTFNVFKYCYIKYGKGVIDFSKDNFQVFYAGYLELEKSAFDGNKVNYDYSYQKYLVVRDSFAGAKVLSIDLQDFFKNIKIKKLIKKMKNTNIEDESIIKTINNIEGFLGNFSSLPQLHYSIASSLLSQVYLESFTEEVNSLLIEKEYSEFKAVRYVDDMYFYMPLHIEDKRKNEFLEKISCILWEDDLNINTKKTKNYSKEEFESFIEQKNNYTYESIQEISAFSNYFNAKIQNKVEELLKNDGEKLGCFLYQLSELYDNKGIELKEYYDILREQIEVEGGSISKVFNHLMFSNNNYISQIGENNLYKVLSDSKFVLFNPSQFTILFIKMNDYIRSRGEFKDFSVNLENLVSGEIDLKRAIIISNMYLQKEEYKSLIYRLDELRGVNDNYIKFINKYIYK